jgi:hypothetical protein
MLNNQKVNPKKIMGIRIPNELNLDRFMGIRIPFP